MKGKKTMKNQKIKSKIRLVVPAPKMEKDAKKEASRKACRRKNNADN